jgi:hypothetical protein
MKTLLLVIALCLLLTVEVSAFTGKFFAGDGFDTLPDSTTLIYEGVTADGTLLIVRKSGTIILDYIPIGIPSGTKVFDRKIFQRVYTLQPNPNGSLTITSAP